MARWLIGLKNDKVSAQKTFRMFNAFLSQKGDLTQSGILSKSELAWLRLQAGCSMLKICEQKGVGDQYTAEQFFLLSRLMMVLCIFFWCNFISSILKCYLFYFRMKYYKFVKYLQENFIKV